MLQLIIHMFHASLIPCISLDQYLNPNLYTIPNMQNMRFFCCSVYNNEGSGEHAITHLISDVPMIRPKGYKTFSMLNSTVHDISTANKNKMLKNRDLSSSQTLRCCIYHAYNC